MSSPKKCFVAFVMLMGAAGCGSADGQGAGPSALAQVADGGAATTPSPLAGSAASNECSSYGEAKPGLCSGYFCGVTEAQVAAAMPADSVCPDPTYLCEGTLLTAVAKCARSTIIANLGSPIEPLKPKMEACVFADATIKDTVSAECVGCYLTAATCAATNCLVPCLSDGPSCDQCRAKFNCEKPVFECAKIPSPL
jgi:hypothetical protein